MEEHVKFAQLDISAEEFHNDENSIYIRCQYVPDIRGFRVTLFNNIKAMDNPDIQDLFVIARGLAEVALHSPMELHQVGMTAHQKDMEQYKSELDPEQIQLLDVEPEGSA